MKTWNVSNWITLFAIAWSVNASFATESQSLVCVTSRPQTQLIVESSPQFGVRLRWYIEGGIENLPLTDGPISSPQLPLIRYQLEDLKSFPATGQLSWSSDQCTIQKMGLLECNGAAEKSASFPFQSLRVSTWWHEQQGVDRVYRQWVILLAVMTESNTYFLPFTFPEELCSLD